MSTSQKREEQLEIPFPLSEWKLVTLREIPPHTERKCYEKPQDAVDYWKANIVQHPYFNPDYECLAVLVLDSMSRFRGHYIVTIGLIRVR